MPDAPEPSNADKKPTKPVGAPPDWSRVFWYLTTMFILLWIWQDVLISTTVRTIPYSEFKDYVARGEVTECTLEENVVVGEITPKESKETKAAANPAPPTIATTEKAVPETSAATSTKDAKAEASSEPSKESKPAESKEAAKPTETKKASNSADVKKEEAKKGEAKKEDAKDTKPKPFFFRTVRVDDPGLVDELQKSGAKFAGDRPSFIQTALVDWGVPIAIMVFIWFLLARRIGAAGQAMMSIGQSKARLIVDRETGVTFNDVAGCDEAKVELNEVVDFLKNPARYESIGARIPKGILLVGPPGTGKTLLARAVAGEAGVPFFSLSGSDFVEMFVGVGASRVRDLFTQAVKSAPCIIFIDELDAIGRQRGVHVGAVNDEREQTLNQLLVEMDGFSANVGVIVLSATNRPDVLDRALLRPGRFDRQIVVDSPDLDGREAILRVHARSIAMESDVDLRQIARATAGFSGADLANVLNEAALLAARRQGTKVSQKDIEDAIERVLAGPERKSRRLVEDERRRVAYHEVGHALVAAYSEYADPVRKITIVPRGRAALGYTLQVPGNEQFLVTRSALFDRVRGLLGGRGAEDVIFGEVSTGAENDLDRATTIVKQMICMYGMGDAVGLMHCARQQNGYLGQSPEIGSEKLVGEQTANVIDQEVRRLLDGCYNETKELLSAHRAELEKVAQELLRVETLSGDAFLGMLDHPIMKKSSEGDPALPPVPPATG